MTDILVATCDSAEGEHLLLIKCDSNGRPSPPRENIERFTRPRFFIITKCCRSSFRHSPTVSISQRKPKNESKKQKTKIPPALVFFFSTKLISIIPPRKFDPPLVPSEFLTTPTTPLECAPCVDKLAHQRM